MKNNMETTIVYRGYVKAAARENGDNYLWFRVDGKDCLFLARCAQ